MIMLLAPGAAGNLTLGGAPSGATYVSDQYGVIRIANGSAADEAALLAAGCTALSAIPGQPGEIDAVTASPYQLASDGAIYFDLTNETGAALTVLLPVSPQLNQLCVITDAGGNAGTYNWTIKAAATPIDTVTANGGFSKLRWNGVAWLITG
jgi:hypothetical protein